MKKTLLTLALSIIGFIGFSSADYTFTSNGGFSYSPESITLTSDIDFSTSILDYSCSYEECGIILSDENFIKNCAINFDGDNFVFNENNNCSFNNGEVVFSVVGASSFSSITFGESSAGESGGSAGGVLTPSSPSNYLSGGTLALKPALDGLKGTMMEFIPYIAYIGLGIIVACIGFIAIRRLVNWVRAKIFDSF